jgi:hypothetical protein
MEISPGSSAAKTPGSRTHQGFPPRQGRRRRGGDLLHPAPTLAAPARPPKLQPPKTLVMTSNECLPSPRTWSLAWTSQSERP